MYKNPTKEQVNQFCKYWESLGASGFMSSHDRAAKLSEIAFSDGYKEAQTEYLNKFPLGYTHRPPTIEDADKNGYVQVLGEHGCWYGEPYQYVSPPTRWIHTPIWEPKSREDIIEEALSLVGNTATLKPKEVLTVMGALKIAKDLLERSKIENSTN